MDKKNQQNLFSKVLKFIESKSFYLVMVLSLGIIVFGGIFITSRNIISSIEFDAKNLFEDSKSDLDLENMTDYASKEDEYQSSHHGISSITSLDLEGKKQILEMQESEPTSNTSENLEVVTPSSKTIEAKKIEFELPVTGKNIFDYSMEKPLYSKTLNDWRTHSGVDIAAALGTQVKASADGVVKEIRNDPRYGHTVVIDHGGEFLSVYASLGEKILVEDNQSVKVGEIIGSIGNTAPFEILLEPHLHFEIIKNNKYHDPKEYLPQLAK